MKSYEVLVLMKSVIPDSLIMMGRTNLPYLMIPKRSVRGIPVGPIRLFYNLTQRRFRIVDDNDKAYEHCTARADEVLSELEALLDITIPPAPEALQDIT